MWSDYIGIPPSRSGGLEPIIVLFVNRIPLVIIECKSPHIPNPRVNKPYDKTKTYGLIMDYCGITKEPQNALAIFKDVKVALDPAEKEVEDLRLRFGGKVILL